MVDGVPPRSSASSATLARPSARSCSTRRARRSVSRMLGSCANARALSTPVREPRTLGSCVRESCARTHPTPTMPRMAYLLGVVRGLDACSSPSGTFTVLALDHRQNLRKELRPADPGSVTDAEMIDFKSAVVRALGTTGTGVLLDPEIGVAPAIADGSLPGRAGLIVAVEATGYEGESGARVSRVLPGWGVGKIKRLGASAAKLLVYYHPDAPNAAAQERLVADVAAACRAQDLALFLEPLSFGLDGSKLTGDERRRVGVETARRLRASGRGAPQAD